MLRPVRNGADDPPGPVSLYVRSVTLQRMAPVGLSDQELSSMKVYSISLLLRSPASQGTISLSFRGTQSHGRRLTHRFLRPSVSAVPVDETVKELPSL